MKRNFQVNMCEGSILKNLLVFAFPLLAANILQLLFNAADITVLGKFIPDAKMADAAVGAVGSTNALINLIIGLFVGFSVGANVLVARCVGENDENRSRRIVGTSMSISIIIGIFLAVLGFFCAKTFLRWMDSPDDVIDMAASYLKIYFLGMPIMMLYNFSSAILRAVGDTVRPLIYLCCGGVVNVGLNIFFVKVVKLDVEGVAIATVVSQLIAAVLTVITLIRSDGHSKFELKKMKISGKDLLDIVKIGLPAGLQGCVFAISNVIIQSTINSFNTDAVTANSIASQIEGFVYYAMYSVALASLSFVSQNYGAGNIARVKKTVWIALAVAVIVGLIVGWGVVLLDRELCSIISKDPKVIDMACERLWIISTTYFLCGFMDTYGNAMRGLGKSTLAMIVSLSGSCLFRILWISTIFKIYPTLRCVYIVYPISWLLTILIYVVLYYPLINKIEKKFGTQKQVTQTEGGKNE